MDKKLGASIFINWILAIVLVILLVFGLTGKGENCNNNDYTTMKPGDTIVYHSPNIPKNIKVNNAKITPYVKVDSIVITYNDILN